MSENFSEAFNFDNVGDLKGGGKLLSVKKKYVIVHTGQGSFLDIDLDSTEPLEQDYDAFYDTAEEAQKVLDERIESINEDIGQDEPSEELADELADVEKMKIYSLTVTLSAQPYEGKTGSDVLDEAYDRAK